MWRAVGRGALGLTGALVLGFLAGELSGWRVLAGPAERWLSARLDWPVHISHQQPGDFRLSLWRGIHLQAAQLRIDAPAWSGAEPLFQAEAVTVRARWRALLSWRQGESLPLRLVSAERLRSHLMRRADGLGNWQGRPQAVARTQQTDGWPVQVGMLATGDGELHYVDLPNQADIQVRMALADWRLQATATGQVRQLPVRGVLHTGTLQPLLDGADAPVAASLQLRVGRAQLQLDGTCVIP